MTITHDPITNSLSLTYPYAQWLEALHRARKLLSIPGRWSGEVSNLNVRGGGCMTDDPTLARYSVSGALEWALDDHKQVWSFWNHICTCNHIKGNLHDWYRRVESEDGCVDIGDVMRLLDRAIRVTERKLNHEQGRETSK